MAFLHLVNCILLTYGPLYVFFKSSALHDLGSRVIGPAVLGYLMTACLKMLIFATLVPVSDQYSLQADLIQELVGLVDIYTMNVVFGWRAVKSADSRSKMIGVGLGWAWADAILSNFLILVLNAAGGEFTWDYILRSLNSNFSAAGIICMSCLVWILLKNSGVVRVVAMVLILVRTVAAPVALKFYTETGVLDLWMTLQLSALFTAALSLTTK